MEGTVDTLKIVIQGESATGVEALKNATSALTDFEAAINKLDVTPLKDIKSSLSSLSRITTSISTLTQSLGRLSSVDVSGLAQSISSVAVSLSGIDASAVKSLNELGIALRVIASMRNVSDIDWSQITTGIQGFVASLAQISDADITRLERLGNALANIGAVIGLSDTSTDIRNIGNEASRATGKLGKFFESIKRIAMYRLIRFALKAITTALKEGIGNIYQYDKALGGDFAKAMDSLATSFLFLKNSLGAMLAPIITSLAPALSLILDIVAEIANAIGYLFAALSGATTFKKAIRVQTEYAEAIDDTTEANERLKKSLLGIDEINALQAPTQTGGGTTAPSPLIMFEEVEIPSWLSDVTKTVAAIAIGFASWRISSNLIKGVSRLSKTTKIILGIVMAISGAFLLVKGAISAITEGLNWGNFTEMLLGVSLLAGGLAIAFGKVGGAVGLLTGGVALLAVGLYNLITTGEMTWPVLAAITTGLLAIGGAISLLTGSWIPLVIAAVVAALGALVALIVENWDAIKAWFVEVGEWIYNNVIIPIGDFFVELWEDIKEFGIWAWEGIKSVWETVATWFDESVIQPVCEFFKGLWESVSGFFVDLWEDIKEIWDSAPTWFNKNIIQPIVGFFKGLWESVSGFFVDLWISIKVTWKTVANWFDNKVIQPIVGFFTGLWEDVSGIFVDLWEDIKGVWETVATWFDEHVIQPIVGFFEDMWEGLKGIINGILAGVETVVNGFVAAINWVIDGLNKISFDVPDWVPGIGGKTIGFNIKHVAEVSLPRLEKGGLVNAGQLFIANEAGPELVGQYGNKSAVMNNEQIVRSVSDGVYAANAEQTALIREQNNLLREMVGLLASGENGGTDLLSAVQRMNRRAGKTLIPLGI